MGVYDDEWLVGLSESEQDPFADWCLVDDVHVDYKGRYRVDEGANRKEARGEASGRLSKDPARPWNREWVGSLKGSAKALKHTHRQDCGPKHPHANTTVKAEDYEERDSGTYPSSVAMIDGGSRAVSVSPFGTPTGKSRQTRTFCDGHKESSTSTTQPAVMSDLVLRTSLPPVGSEEIGPLVRASEQSRDKLVTSWRVGTDQVSQTIARRPIDKFRDVQIRLRLFIPSPLIYLPRLGSAPSESSAMPAIQATPSPRPGIAVAGDGRGFSYDQGSHRFQLDGVLRYDSSLSEPLVSYTAAFGASGTYHGAAVQRPKNKPWWWADATPGEQLPEPVRHTARVTKKNFSLASGWSGHRMWLRLRLSGTVAADAWEYDLSPAIDLEAFLFVTYCAEVFPGSIKQPNKPFYELHVEHDGFPAYELYLNRKMVYGYDPVAANSSPINLFPPMDVNVRDHTGDLATE